MEAEIRGYFEAEAKELIDRLTQGVGLLQGLDREAAGPALAAALPEIKRAAHTLKGAAHVVGERVLAGLAHRFEDAVAAYRDDPTARGAAGLLAAVDGLASALAGGGVDPPAASEEKPAGAAAGEAAGAAQDEPGLEVAEPAGETPFPRRQTVRQATRRTVRVDVAHATSLLNGLEESGTMLGAMRALLLELEALVQQTGGQGAATGQAAVPGTLALSWEQTKVRRDFVRRQLMDQQERLERTMRDLQAAGAHLRLGSAETLLLEAGRTVRATAAAVGRRVAFLSHGGEERLDVRLQDALQDALLHLLRNAVAHGVEPAAERVAAGKKAEATVEVNVARLGRFMEVRCADDGRGIDVEALRARAAELGMAVPAARGAALALLLQPGFNRGGPVTEISGRGVGMDAVREAMAGVGGTVEIASEAGRGTTFTLRVPQSLFALETLDVMAGGRMFALPLAQVEQTFRMDRHLTEQVQGASSLRVGPEMIRFVRLDDAFPAQAGSSAMEEEGSRETCVVLKMGGERLALGVDRLMGVSDTLVRPVSALAGVGAHVAGTAMTAEGMPYLAVNAEELLRLVRSGGVRESAQSGTKQRAAGERKPILVIDDSLTTRMLEQSILEMEGYEVELANSAEQGLAMAREKPYAMFLVDVEMPGMNGFEFVSLVTTDAQLKTTPAILVTSLDSPEHRERGRAAGAVSYVVKGEFNQQVYLDRIRAVVGRSA